MRSKVKFLKQLTFSNLVALFLIGFLVVWLAGSFILHEPATVASAQQVTKGKAPEPIPLKIFEYPTDTFSLSVNPTSFVPKGRKISPPQAIITEDNRVRLESTRYPWSAVGRVDIWDKAQKKFVHQCTGTLVKPNLVLTNAHCVNWWMEVNQGKWVKQVAEALQFKPNYYGGFIGGAPGNESDTANVKAAYIGTDFPNGHTNESQADDWALLELNSSPGSKYGTIAWKSIPTNELLKKGKAFYLAGYSGDFPTTAREKDKGETPGLHPICQIKQEGIVSEDRSVILHECDTTGGASGSGILTWDDKDKTYHIIALHRGSVTFSDGKVQNVAVEISKIQEDIKKWQARKGN